MGLICGWLSSWLLVYSLSANGDRQLTNSSGFFIKDVRGVHPELIANVVSVDPLTIPKMPESLCVIEFDFGPLDNAGEKRIDQPDYLWTEKSRVPARDPGSNPGRSKRIYTEARE